jgi:hypothetical protein
VPTAGAHGTSGAAGQSSADLPTFRRLPAPGTPFQATCALCGCRAGSAARLAAVAKYLEKRKHRNFKKKARPGLVQTEVVFARKRRVQRILGARRSARQPCSGGRRARERVSITTPGRLCAAQVRYESRKRLAEARPRVRGMFVKASALAAAAGGEGASGAAAGNGTANGHGSRSASASAANGSSKRDAPAGDDEGSESEEDGE